MYLFAHIFLQEKLFNEMKGNKKYFLTYFTEISLMSVRILDDFWNIRKN